jgi:signal transduction histidine kinase
MMRQSATPSLRSRLVWRLVPLQAALLTLLVLLVVGTLWGTGLLLDNRDEEHVIDVLQKAVERDAEGKLDLVSTPALKALRSSVPDLWFIIRDKQGQSLSKGSVPVEFARIGNALDHISQARLGWQLLDDDPRKPAARLKRVDTAAGNVQILTATQGSMSAGKAALVTSFVFLGFALPSLLFMTLATVIATPVVIRRALTGLDAAADQARRIDIERRGARLPVEHVPAEIVPLVNAVNDALARLDEGYARHKRFAADAAHELRTPIAILSTRLESLPQGPDKVRLTEDAARLATLAEQLLDIQRLNQNRAPFARVDLVAIGQRVVADLAPLAIGAGYDISFESAASRIETMGDQTALERALTNLIQNAIEHGGRRGTIGVRVTLPATIDVLDQGAGIPEEQRARIFEPFYRVQPLNRGAGLGLNLVREIVHLHEGRVAVLDNQHGGACFRITLPPMF